uniref:ADP-dependent glucokinase n=1 Tax=Arion vulgaris TaxID=1028688 RepID=A0A0B7BIV7_9EUPU
MLKMFAASKSSLCLALCFAALSVLYYRYNDFESDDANSLEKNVIKSWANLISPPVKQFQKLAVGINSNIDIIVPGVALLKALSILPGEKKNHDALSSLDELQETFAHFFSKGSAAERSFMDKLVYQKIIKATETLNNIEHFVGGNAALMATKASNLFPNLKINFVGPVGPILENLMPKSVKIPKSSRIPQDEVHLIMEYKVGEKWGSTSAPVANRFITSHDISNAKIIMLEPFFESIAAFQPDLIVLSGLQIMDSQSPEFFHQRLDTVVSLLQQVPANVPVHLELASMANRDFVKHIIDKMFQHGATSVGLNEQELGLLSVVGNGPHQDLIPALSPKVVPTVNSLGLNEQELLFSSEVSDGPHKENVENNHGQPEIHKISDIMLWLLKNYGRSSKNPTARLTRIHFHSLTYHIVAVVESEWSNVEKAVAAGTQVAGLQACDIPQLNENLVELKIPLRFKLHSDDKERDFDATNPVLSWRKDGYLFVFSPVLVCKRPVKTVGLGDAISATGLMFSQFNS